MPNYSNELSYLEKYANPYFFNKNRKFHNMFLLMSKLSSGENAMENISSIYTYSNKSKEQMSCFLRKTAEKSAGLQLPKNE